MNNKPKNKKQTTILGSSDAYMSFFEQSRDAMFINTRDGELIDFNQAFLDLFGHGREKIAAMNVSELYVDPDERKRFKQEIEQKGSVIDYETTFCRKNGVKMHCLITATVRRGDDGGILGYHGIIRDFTECQKEREALRKSEERLRDYLENASDVVLIHDLSGSIKWANLEARRIYGYSPDEISGLNIAQIVAAEYLPQARKKIRDSLKYESSSAPYELLTYSKGRKPIWVEISNRIHKREGQPIEMLSIARDVTKRKRAEQKVQAYQEKLRSMASELSLIEERERRSIAIELHDRLGQCLAMAKIKLNDMKEEASDYSLAASLNEVTGLIDKVTDETRSLIFEISPPILYELGFEASVDWLCEQMEKVNGIPTKLINDSHLKPINEDTRVVLFRAVRELLSNVAKHARAKKVLVSIGREGEKIVIKVEDDGIGIDTASIHFPLTKNDKFGLFSIRERLIHYGGSLEIESEPGAGTRVTLMAPLSYRKTG